MADGADAPTGLIGRDHRRVADLLAQLLVGRPRVAGRTMQQMLMLEASRRHLQAEAGLQHVGDLGQRMPAWVCNSTTSATTPGPSCARAAPNASEVCRAWRPWTRTTEERPTAFCFMIPITEEWRGRLYLCMTTALAGRQLAGSEPYRVPRRLVLLL